MLNEPPSGQRRQHPLERPPTPSPRPPQQQPGTPRQQVTLHFPAVQPMVTYTIIAINLVVFVMRALSPDWDQRIFLWGANIPSEVLSSGEYHRLLTSMFLHAGIYGPRGTFAPFGVMHILFNMSILYSVGTQLERLFGHVRFALIYLLGGLAGSVLSTVLSGNVASVGASGAVFAILGAEGVYLYRHRKLLGAAAQAQLRSLIMMGLINLAYGLLNSAFGTTVRIDNFAHLGGLIGGMALAWFIGPLWIPRRHPERPDHLLAEDVNPLQRRYGVLSLYVSALLVLLIVASSLVRR